MKLQRLVALGILISCFHIQQGSAPAREPTGCSQESEDLGDGFLRVPDQCGGYRDVPYIPQPGDMLIYDNMLPLNHFAYDLAGAGGPTHSAIAFLTADHHTVLLDLTGPTLPQTKVVILEVGPRLRSYSGKIVMRRLKQPLTCEQCTALANFAMAQQGKHFATFRCFLQLTPLRTRVGLRRWLFGRTYFGRRRWLCSELVVAAATAAGVFNEDAHPANAIYPRDLARDELLDLSAIYEPPVEWRAASDR
jgi:hypothetical protein